MFEDKTMVADTLAGINGELMRFGEMIPQTENKELKTTLKQFRAACEQSQEELYQIAREKSYYVPAAEATQKEIPHVRNLFPKAACRQNSGGIIRRCFLFSYRKLRFHTIKMLAERAFYCF